MGLPRWEGSRARGLVGLGLVPSRATRGPAHACSRGTTPRCHPLLRGPAPGRRGGRFGKLLRHAAAAAAWSLLPWCSQDKP